MAIAGIVPKGGAVTLAVSRAVVGIVVREEPLAEAVVALEVEEPLRHGKA